MKRTSQTSLQPSHDPVKKLTLIRLPDKPCGIFTVLARISLLFLLISSISLVLYTAFFPQTLSLRLPTPKRTDPQPEPNLGFTPTNISHILFGIGGSAATWHNRNQYSSLWWDSNKTRGFVWLDKSPIKKDNGKSGPPYRISSSGWSLFKFLGLKPAERIARIISDSFKLKLQNVRWFVMGDDDTVFFTENLVSVLAKYDHNQMWYIGGNSESVEQNVMHAYDMAFGGGGFAISYPLAEKLVNRLDGCLDRYYNFYGSDERISACISEIGVPLTIEHGFHQFDIRGDAYGLLAAHPVVPLVSLHHLDYLNPIFPFQSQMDSLKSLNQAYRIDPARILQQSFCFDHNRKWSISISWGYTIQIYPSLLPPKALQIPLQTFKTWRSSSDGPFTFNIRPMRANPCELPAKFMLERAEGVGQSGSLTSYERLVPRPEETCNRTDYAKVMSLKRIVVSALKLDPEYWTKVQTRQRQCCDLTNGGTIKNSSMQIRIRKCRSVLQHS